MLTEDQIKQNKERIVSSLMSTQRNGVENIIENFMFKTDFFTAPASTKYHDDYTGGLADHSLKVMDIMMKFAKQMFGDEFLESNKNSIIITSLLHDICKVDCYKESKRNKKINGKWQEVPFWEYENKRPIAVHGPASTIIIQNFVRLTIEEIMAISWHSGAFNLIGNELSSYMNANEYSPLVYMLHFSDMMSVSNYKI